MTSGSSLVPQLIHPLPPHQALQERRARCETQNTDPVVWTNQRVLKWVRDIDLKVRGDGACGGDSRAEANPMHMCVQTNTHFCVSWGTDAQAGKNNLPPVTQEEGTTHLLPRRGLPKMMLFSEWG